MYKIAPPPPDLIDFLKNHDKFLIVGHKEPDGDCISSQLALCLGLQSLGKTALTYSDGPFKRSEINKYKDDFPAVIAASDKKGAAAIVVDCSTPERTGGIGPQIEGLPLAIIDHHQRGEHVGDAVFVDADSPATALLIFEVLKALNVKIDAHIAGILFLGLSTDSGFFRHLDGGSADVFIQASDLIKLGANPKATFEQMNGGKSVNSRALLGTILCKIKPYFGGRLILTTEELEESEHYGRESRDSDALYQLIQSIEGVEAIAVIRQESAENCTIGLRSKNAVDVGKIAADLGGGGHKNAAGGLVSGKIQDIQPIVLSEFEKIFT
ncbi:MAG: bifunctional oligoribonuclease/PAP phosphatase NrnA [Termitinemataceae bacterium]|nr:MAG: bifunctional oligoribonuclease/PAP phosphatase NrnA [Termitinemataceae bacterium]